MAKYVATLNHTFTSKVSEAATGFGVTISKVTKQTVGISSNCTINGSSVIVNGFQYNVVLSPAATGGTISQITNSLTLTAKTHNAKFDGKDPIVEGDSVTGITATYTNSSTGATTSLADIVTITVSNAGQTVVSVP